MFSHAYAALYKSSCIVNAPRNKQPKLRRDGKSRLDHRQGGSYHATIAQGRGPVLGYVPSQSIPVDLQGRVPVPPEQRFLISEANLPCLKPLDLGVETVNEVQPFPRRLIETHDDVLPLIAYLLQIDHLAL